jgi:hypothetical protein
MTSYGVLRVSTELRGPEDDGTCALIFEDQCTSPILWSSVFAFWVNFVMYSKWQSSIGRFSQSGDDHLYEDLANFGYKQHMKVLNILLF